MKVCYKVYGLAGHRQQASFWHSTSFTTWAGDTCTLLCADTTGTNEYALLITEGKNLEECRERFYGQFCDGVFENCRCGKVTELVLDGESTETTIY